MDKENLADIIEAAINNVHDMDVTFRQYAEATAGAIFAAQITAIPPLVWEVMQRDNDMEQYSQLCAQAFDGYYCVNHSALFMGKKYKWSFTSPSNFIAYGHETEEAAQAAANEHHVAGLLKAMGWSK